MGDSRQDLIVFHSAKELTHDQAALIREQIGGVADGLQVLICGPGDTVSMPMDTRRLYESVSRLHELVSELVQINQQLLASNQEMLAEIIEMHQEAEEVSNPEHHLGLGSLG